MNGEEKNNETFNTIKESCINDAFKQDKTFYFDQENHIKLTNTS